MPPRDDATFRRKTLLACCLLALACLAAYANTFQVPFFFDDRQAITENDSIKQLSWPALNPPTAYVSGASGRPLVQFSLAINYAISGNNVWSYHLVNLFIHTLAAWLLLGVTRRTLEREPLAKKFGGDALPLAFIISLVWSVHPLLTETVTCIVQRNESLMAVFYLLTIYCLIRAMDSAQSRRWQAGAVAACLLGMATKEVMVTAPVLVLLYDRTFITGDFRKTWATRQKFYAALAASWMLLAVLILKANQRGGTVGFGLGVAPWSYALKQCEAIIHYVRLAFWPYPLVFDYGTDVIDHFSAVWPQALLLLGLLGGTLYALVRKPALGFAGAWVFLILAPSSSIIPLTTQTEAEHRMYLPLAAVVAMAVLCSYVWAGRRSYLIWTGAALALGLAAFLRNREYHSEISMWEVTVQRRPDNESARYNLGCALFANKDYPQAAEAFALALKLQPKDGEARANYGITLFKLGQRTEAIRQLNLAIEATPDNFISLYSLGCALAAARELPKALRCFQEALLLKPQSDLAQNGLGSALTLSGKPTEAIAHFEAALSINPANAQTHSNYGVALLTLGRTQDAITQLEEAVRLQPDSGTARQRLAAALLAGQENAEAYAQAYEAVRLEPDDAEIHFTLGNILNVMHETTAAVTEYSKALLLQPDYAQAANNLGYSLQQLGRNVEALAAYNRALELQPDYAEARRNRDSLLKPSASL